jgi:anti-anti-sigma factor
MRGSIENPTVKASAPMEIRTDGDGTVWVAGELDLATADQLLEQLRHAAEVHPNVIVDVRDVTFLDSSGLRAILTVASSERGTEIVLRNPRPNVRKLIHVAGLESRPGLRLEGDA